MIKEKIHAAIGSFVRFAGHGRALEMFLAGLKILIFLQFFPFAPFHVWPTQVPALAGFDVSALVLAAPFLIVGLTQAFGLWLNYKGFEFSWFVRACGAFVALVMWSWILLKTLLIGVATPFLVPLAIMGFGASVFILWKAANKLPIPGAPGLP